jgi:hypothetical protein
LLLLGSLFSVGSLLNIAFPEKTYAQTVVGSKTYTLDIKQTEEWEKYAEGTQPEKIPKITVTITTYTNQETKAQLTWDKPSGGANPRSDAVFEQYVVNWAVGNDPRVAPTSWNLTTKIQDFNQTTYSFSPAVSGNPTGLILYLQVIPNYKIGGAGGGLSGSPTPVIVADLNDPANPKLSYIGVSDYTPRESKDGCTIEYLDPSNKKIDGSSTRRKVDVETGFEVNPLLTAVSLGTLSLPFHMVCFMMRTVTGVVDWFINWSAKNFLFPAIGLSGVKGGTPASQEIKTLPVVQGIWKINIVLVDTILILALIFVAIVNIARISIDTYAIKKILPTLILATILAHFSILVTQLIVESSEVLVVNFVNGDIDTWSSQLTLAVGWPAAFNAFGKLLVFVPFAGWVLSIVFSFLPVILILVLALMMWFRHLALYFLVAFAPIAIIMMALPATEKLFKQWLTIFLKVTYLSTIAIIFIFYAIEFGMKGFGRATEFLGTTGVEPGSFVGSAAGFFGAIGMLFLAVFVPISIGKGVPGLGSVFGGIGSMLKKGGGLVGKGAGKKADTMFAGATSGNTFIPGLRQMNQKLGRFAPLKAIGVGSYKGVSGVGLYKGWQGNADRRWNQRIGEEMGRGEDIRELTTHLGKVIGIGAGGVRKRGDAWKQISEAANSRFNETQRTQLLTESRTMGNDNLTSDDAITRTAESAISNNNQHDAQRALLAARSRNLPESDKLWHEYLNKFDKNVGNDLEKEKDRKTVSVENLAFQEMLAFEAEKSGGFHEQRFGMNDKGQVIRRSDNEVTDVLVESARKQLNRTTGKQRQQVVKNIVIHAADDQTGRLGTPADRGTVTTGFNATQQAMREVLTEHFPTGGIEQAAGDDLIHTRNLKTKVDIKGVEEQLSLEALDDQREGKSRRTTWNEAAARMGGGTTGPPPPPPPPNP